MKVKNFLKYNNGISIIEVLIGVAMMGFFSLLVQENFRQTDYLYKKATIRSDMDRMKQLLQGALKNATRVKAAIKTTLGDATYDELLNCFGQKGLAQSVRLPGINCNIKFPAPGNVWANLNEPANESFFNQSWSASGNCDPALAPCYLETTTKYYITCNALKCFAAHINLTISPTSTMMNQKDELMKRGYSADDFTVKQYQVTLPVTSFGQANQLRTEGCTSLSGFMRSIDFEYQMILCNDENLDVTHCDVALRSINGINSCSLSSTIFNEVKTDGTITPALIDTTKDNSNTTLTLTAIPSASDGTRKRPDPSDLTKMISEPIPFVNPAKGDVVKIDCGAPIGSVEVTGPSYTKNVTVNLSGFANNADITCLFYVATVTGGSKGLIGHSNIHFWNSVTGAGALVSGGGGLPGGGAGNTGPAPPSVDSSFL